MSTPAAITIRRFAPGDGAVLLAMVRALAEDHDLAAHLIASASDFDTAFGPDDGRRGAFIAEVDGKPAGCAIWHGSFSSFRGKEVLYLEDLSVLPEFRRRGVGRALMRQVAQECRTRGWASMFWVMMSSNGRGRALYEGLGAEVDDGLAWCRLRGTALEALAT